MSSVARWGAAPVLAIVVMGSLATAGVVAQDASPLPDPLPSPARGERPSPPLAPSDAARCQLWADRQVPVVTRPRFAAVGAVDVSGAAVDVEQVEPACTLSEETLAEPPGLVEDMLHEIAVDWRAFRRDDLPGDQLTLGGDPFAGDPDPALDITRVSFGSVDLGGRQARSLARWLEGDEFADGHHVTLGRRPGDWVEPGMFQIVILGLGGDPTVPPETDRIWQVGFQGRDPSKAVVPAIPVSSPIAGVRNLLTYGQVAQEDGSVRRSVGRSDFGSRKVGPDGQTQYYNARPDAAVLEWRDGVAFLFPEAYDPLGFRPMTFDRQSGAWDMVVAPGGPMAFLPASGGAPGMFDFVGLVLDHEAIDLPATIDGVAADGPMTFPSQNRLVFGSSVFDPSRPVLVDLAYDVEGHVVGFTDLTADPLGEGLFGVPYGIPQYGRYALTSLVLEQEGIAVPETWDQLVEALRSLGTGAWRVDETEGPLLGHAVPRAWATAPDTAQLHPYDPELARQLLEEAGFIIES